MLRAASLVVLIFSALLLLAARTRAQGWSVGQVSYAGGTPAASGGAVIGSSDSHTVAGGGGPGSSLSISGVTGTIVCTGPPTKCVVVAETVAEIGNAQNSPSYSDTTTYTVKDGSSGSITLTSPAMSASVTDGPHGGGMGAGCNYSATLSPVTVSLSGTTTDTDGSQNILVGQGCSAGLSGLPPAFFPSYQWSVSGTTFQSWNVSPDQTSATVVSGPGDLINLLGPPKWYWYEQPATETVSCTATVPVPAAQGGPLTVTASKQVNVKEPFFTFFDLELGDPGIFADGLGSSSVYSAGKYQADSPGFGVNAYVGTPALFGTNVGQSAWLQICSLYREVEIEGDAIDDTHYDEFECLDSAFPYDTSGNGGDNPGQTSGTGIEPISGWGGRNSFDDIPELTFINLANYFLINDTFRLHLMYLPPDGDAGANWVPLSALNWGWTASGFRSRFVAWPDQQTGIGSVHYDGEHDNPPYPTWDQKVNSASSR